MSDSDNDSNGGDKEERKKIIFLKLDTGEIREFSTPCKISFGSGEENDVIPMNVDVAGKHAVLEVSNTGSAVLFDLGSEYGTFLDDDDGVEEGGFTQVTGSTTVEIGGDFGGSGGLFYFGNPSKFDRFQVISKASCNNNLRVRHLPTKDLVDLYAEINVVYQPLTVTLPPFTCPQPSMKLGVFPAVDMTLLVPPPPVEEFNLDDSFKGSSVSLPRVLENFRAKQMVTDEIASAMLLDGSTEYAQSKIMMVGEGRAGKSATANSLIGREYVETTSTIGINQLTCDVKYILTAAATAAAADGSGNSGEGEQTMVWGEYEKPPSEAEAAIAEMIRSSTGTGRSTDGKKTAAGKGKQLENKQQNILDFVQSKPKKKSQLLTGEEHSLAIETGGEAAQNGRDKQTTTEKKLTSAPDGNHVSKPPQKPSDPKKAVSTSPKKNVISSSAATGARPDNAAAVSSQPMKTSGTNNKKTNAVPLASAAVDDIFTLNKEAIIKHLATHKDEKSGIVLSIFDYGGQTVFDVIHHLFLTSNGVYALSFNMEWLLDGNPERNKALAFLRSWLSSIAVHTLDEATNAIAPIVLIGTHLDVVTSSADHERINTLLYQSLSHNRAFPFILENVNGYDSKGKATQCFFPVNNKLGKRGPTMRHLMGVIQKAVDSAPYTHKLVPITWLKAKDQFVATGKDCLSYEEVEAVAERCKVPSAALPVLLSFLHDMGHLMWHNEPALKDVVILDPVSYLVVPATNIICKLSPDQYDSTHHFIEEHRECKQRLPAEWNKLEKFAILDIALLPVLWRKYEAHTAKLLALMVKFGLIVPLRNRHSTPSSAPSAANTPAAGAGTGAQSALPSATTTETAFHPVQQYLVPTLLPATPTGGESAAEYCNWADGPTTACYIVFTLFPELAAMSTISSAELAKQGFLPNGLFARATGRFVAASQNTVKGSSLQLDRVVLHSDLLVLCFGRQRFRVVECKELNCMRVDIEGRNPNIVLGQLLETLTQVLAESFKALRCFAAVPYLSTSGPVALTPGHASSSSGVSSTNGGVHTSEGGQQQGKEEGEAESYLRKSLLPNEMLIPLSHIEAASTGKSTLTMRGGRSLLRQDEVLIRYAPWLQLYNRRDSYDLFLSYRWNPYDLEFTKSLFDMLSNFDIGKDNRMPEVFLDRKRLQNGIEFTEDFAAALTHCLVAVPILSAEAINRMINHDPNIVDNLLLEWIMLLECLAIKRLQRIFPILFGTRKSPLQFNSNNNSSDMLNYAMSAPQVGNLFTEGLLEKVPNVVPTATIERAVELLRKNGVTFVGPAANAGFEGATYTVQAVVKKLLGYLALPAWEINTADGEQVVEVCAVKLVDVLRGCDLTVYQSPPPQSQSQTQAQGHSEGLMSSPSPKTVASTSSSPFPAPVPAPASDAPGALTKPLKSLSVEEVGELMVTIGLKQLKDILVSHEVSGIILSACEEVSDLLSDDIGIKSKIQARALFKELESWNANGV
jgi:GTPase SAR1 family protein